MGLFDSYIGNFFINDSIKPIDFNNIDRTKIEKYVTIKNLRFVIIVLDEIKVSKNYR